MTSKFFAPVAVISLSFAASAIALPTTSAYVTDPQSDYVQDDTSDSISSLNMVLCIVGSMGAGSMVNAGPYVALVDMNKCDNKQASAAGAGATNYATAVLDVTRASNSDPMIGKVWLSMSDQGNAVDVFLHLSATQSPSSSQPYGLFRLDYLGKKNGTTGFNGFVDSQPTTISQFETGNNSSNTAMALSATSTTSGAGTIATIGGASFNFAYDASHFRRSDGTHDECFDRSKANAERSVWQYGTYNANDGSRVDMAHPGFPVVAVDAGVSYYGFANYWGINFQGLDLNSIADAQPVSALAVKDQRPGNTSAYTLSKVGGKLTKWTQQSTTLDSLSGLPFSFSGDLTGRTDNVSVSGFQNWQMQWSSANQTFSVIGTQQCGSNGCTTTPLSPAAIVNATAFNTDPISGWADSYGGSINIPPTGVPHVAADPVFSYGQSMVVPGSVSLALYCLSQCPTAAAFAAFPSGTAQASPFGNNTDQQWFSAPAANTVSYSFDGAGLEESSSAAPLVLEQANQYPQGSVYAQNGISSGRLFDAPLTLANCPSMTPMGTVCEPANPTTYYTWATGPQQWQQSLWLNGASNVVAFDAPQNVSYTVPNDSAYGSYAGVPILLQFNGFGNLYGIPGTCVDPVNNASVTCNTPNSRYVPLFSLPDGALMTLPIPMTPLIVKALNAEIRLKNLGTSASSPCASMVLATVPPPTGGTHDPSSSADSFYIGVKPVVTAAPKVIDGVIQP